MDDAQNSVCSNQSTNRSQFKVGCVSYLNAKPLIAGLDQSYPNIDVKYDVPSNLLDDLLDDQVDIALCPVVDYFRSELPLKIVPVGGICSQDRTLTVCLFSKTPIEQLTEIHADTDSHTSVNLLRVIMAKQYQQQPTIINFDARKSMKQLPNAMLLIGDKVVTSSPKAVQYPYQLDLGQAWAQLTGLPFMFATWLAKEQTKLGDLPLWLNKNRKRNQPRCHDLAQKYAHEHGWPESLAYDYLTKNLHYDVGEKELAAMKLFAEYLFELNLIQQVRDLNL